MHQSSFEGAIEKARIKRAIAEQLALLPRDAQRDVLADLLLALDDANGAARVSPSGANGAADSLRRLPIQGELIQGAPLRPTGKAGRPAQGAQEGGRTDAVYAALKARPRTPIADLAKIIYPEHPEATHRVRAILWSLKKQGRATNVEPGQWEVTDG